MNIAYYLYAQNLYFDYVNNFVPKNPTIATPSEFKLSENDFSNFKTYLVDKKFSYVTESEKMFDEFMELAKSEGVDKYAGAEMDSLKIKLKPDILKNIDANKGDIEELLSLEIIKRYYFQKGEIEFSLKKDEELKMAIAKLTDITEYNTTLNIK